MYGQLNLFTFKPKVKIFYPTPISLNKELWSIVKKTDDRGYSFGSFNVYRNRKGKIVKNNKNCATVVIYNGVKPIGFCTLSYINESDMRDPYIDVWIMPYYRDMGFGSLLVNRANEKCFKLTGQLPKGSDKHHIHCWDARFRRDYAYNNESYIYQYQMVDKSNQLSLFKLNVLYPRSK